MESNVKRDSISVYTSEISKLKQEIQALKEKNASLERKELVYAQRFIRNSMPNVSETAMNIGGSNEEGSKHNMANSSISEIMRKYEGKNDELSSQLITITDKLKELVEGRNESEVLKLEITQLNKDNAYLREKLASDDKDIALKDKEMADQLKSIKGLEKKLLIITKEIEEKKSREVNRQWGYELKESKVKSFSLKAMKDSSMNSTSDSSMYKFKNEILIEIRNLISEKGGDVRLIKQNSITTHNKDKEDLIMEKIDRLTLFISNITSYRAEPLFNPTERVFDSKERITDNPEYLFSKDIKESDLPLSKIVLNKESKALMTFDDFLLKVSDITTLFTKGWKLKANTIYPQSTLNQFSSAKVASVALLSNCQSSLIHSFICQLTNRDYDQFLSITNIHFKYFIESQPPLLISCSLLSHSQSLSSLFLDKFLYQSSSLPIFFTDLLSHTNIEYLLRIISNCKEKKKLFIVHNLSSFSFLSSIDDYIKNYLMNGLFSPNIKKTFMLSLKDIKMKTNKNYWFYSDCLQSCQINHLFFAKEHSEAGNYYNETTFDFLFKTINLLSNDKEFVIENQMAHFIQNNFDLAKSLMSKEPIMIQEVGWVKVNQVFQTDLMQKLKKLNELDYYDSLIENFTPDYMVQLFKRKIRVVIEVNDLVTTLFVNIHPIDSVAYDDKNAIYSFEVKGEKLLKYSPMHFLESQSAMSTGMSFSNRKGGRFCLRFDYKIPKKLTYLLSRKGSISHELGMLIITYE